MEYEFEMQSKVLADKAGVEDFTVFVTGEFEVEDVVQYDTPQGASKVKAVVSKRVVSAHLDDGTDITSLFNELAAGEFVRYTDQIEAEIVDRHLE